MNIDDFKPYTGLTFERVKHLQKGLWEQYEPGVSEIIKNFDIDDPGDQERFKVICARIAEEVSEATDAMRKDENTHYKEELVDVFNFTLELFILCGMEPLHFNNESFVEPLCMYRGVPEIAHQVWMIANLLKGRQWRKSQYLVDRKIFKDRMEILWHSLVWLINVTFRKNGLDFFEVWSLKYQVNLFRLDTKY